MLTEERFAKILSILESMGSVTVQQLMTELNASESTIRRDLNALDANGQLTKVHGGAILKTMAYSTKDDNVVSRKERIVTQRTKLQNTPQNRSHRVILFIWMPERQQS